MFRRLHHGPVREPPLLTSGTSTDGASFLGVRRLLAGQNVRRIARGCLWLLETTPSAGYGDWTFRYTKAGELEKKTNAATGESIDFRYDGFGNLEEVGLPDGGRVEYESDDVQRRIVREVIDAHDGRPCGLM